MLRPAHHLIAAGKLYPSAWLQTDNFRQDRGKGLPDWPEFCFLPMAAYYAIVSADLQVERLPVPIVGDVARLAALSAWRVSQGIYRFDTTLAQALIDSPLTGAIPVEVLHRLPEWCVYVETPGYLFYGQPLYGFFAHLEFDVNTRRTELRLLLDDAVALIPFVLHLGHWTVIEAIDRATAESSKQAAAAGIDYTLGMDAIEQMGAELRPLMSLLLYLCSETPEFSGGTTGCAAPKKTKKGWRLFPPDQPKIITVGAAIGEALRTNLIDTTPREPGIGTPKRPHVRRGHWHGFWTGAKKDRQKFTYKWLPPMTINIESP